MPSDDQPPYRRRRALVALLLIVIVVLGVGVPYALLGPLPAADAAISADLATTTTAAKVAFPDFGHSAVGVVGIKGVLATSGSQEQRPIASITKVITALTVLEKFPLRPHHGGPTITFTQKDVGYWQQVLADDGSAEPVEVGMTMNEVDALETMLLPSANNYAESLAVWAYGSVPKYLVAARAFLKTHGLTHTKLVDSNGLGDGDQSTPSDLVALGELALANPVLAAIVGEATATEPTIGDVLNTNALLHHYGVNGIKTGTTDAAGACLLFSAKRTVNGRTVQIVGVILDATTHAQIDAVVPKLLDSVQKGLHDVPLASKGEVIGTYRTAWGAPRRRSQRHRSGRSSGRSSRSQAGRRSTRSVVVRGARTSAPSTSRSTAASSRPS